MTRVTNPNLHHHKVFGRKYGNKRTGELPKSAPHTSLLSLYPSPATSIEPMVVCSTEGEIVRTDRLTRTERTKKLFLDDKTHSQEQGNAGTRVRVVSRTN